MSVYQDVLSFIRKAKPFKEYDIGGAALDYISFDFSKDPYGDSLWVADRARFGEDAAQVTLSLATYSKQSSPAKKLFEKLKVAFGAGPESVSREDSKSPRIHHSVIIERKQAKASLELEVQAALVLASTG